MDWDLVTIFTFVIALIVVRGYMKRLPVQGAGLSGPDQSALSSAMDTARRLEQRVETLERLLDEDAPGWRARARA
jgi:phage shock protein B